MSVTRFKSLFLGNMRSFGHWTGTSALTISDVKISEDKGEPYRVMPHDEFNQYRERLFESHLASDNSDGIGIAPLMDDSTCWFGAIDIDAHSQGEEVDLKRIQRDIVQDDLPLVACRSKSGGAHLYLFGMEPLRGELVRKVLTRWSTKLGVRGSEIFPKQIKYQQEKTQNKRAMVFEGRPVLQFGSWINLPYEGGDDTIRYAIRGSKELTLEEFMGLAEESRVSNAQLNEFLDDEFKDAPPCLQKLAAQGVEYGNRNEALYNFCIYFKQAFPDTWRDKAFDVNAKIFEEPLPHGEAKKCINSVARKDYRYKCKEEPIQSLCNSQLCVQRKFGITPDERGELHMGTAPEFTGLKKILTEPVIWVLEIQNRSVELSTEQLMDFRLVRNALLEKLTILCPPMKNDRWQIQLHKMIDEVSMIDAPEDASPAGLLRERLYEFLRKAELSSDGTDTSDREAIRRNQPVVQYHKSSGTRRVFFRGSAFVEFLQKNKAEYFKGAKLWEKLRKMGVDYGMLKISGSPVNVWSVEVNPEDGIEIPISKTPNMDDLDEF